MFALPCAAHDGDLFTKIKNADIFRKILLFEAFLNYIGISFFSALFKSQ